MNQIKRYPFSFRKHEHDIFYRYNRAKNELDDKRATATPKDIGRYEELIENLAKLMCHRPDEKGIVWLTGKEYGLANDCVCWAASMRH